MRFIVVYFFLLFVATNLPAQREFAPIGATWYYGFYDAAFGISLFDGYEEMTYNRDTVIDDIACKVLSRRRVGERADELISYTVADKIIYQAGYQVFVRMGEEFVKIYDFGLVPGETIAIAYPGCEEVYQVDSVYYEELDGEELKNILMTNVAGGGQYLINEKFGATADYLFFGENTCALDVGEHLSFRCYEDDEFAHYQADSIACDAYNNISQIVGLEKTGIRVYPNALEDLFLLKNSSGDTYDLAVFNLAGHLMYQSFAVKEGQKEIDCAEWLPGTYVVQLKMGTQRAFEKLQKPN